MLKDECSILILSCDKNKNLLSIFFEFFKKNWSDCDMNIFLGLEEKKIVNNGVTTLNSTERSFAGRLKEYLGIIETPYVLVLLDDFILERKINTIEINKYFNYVYDDKKVATLSLVNIHGEVEKTYAENIMKKKWNADYLVNLQAGFWNKEFLNNILKKGENAWQIELFGSIRARKYKDYHFLHISDDKDMPYLYNRGWLMVKGAWNGNEIIRLHLEDYATRFLDGRKIVYSDFGMIKKKDVLEIRFGVLVRKIFSWTKIYF